MWIITNTYEGSFFQVWSLGLTGKYIIMNVVFSALASGIQSLEAFPKTIEKFGTCNLCVLARLRFHVCFFPGDGGKL